MLINILGCGVMGRQIASLCVLMGCDVVVWVRRDVARHTEELERQLQRDRRVLRRFITAEGSFMVHDDFGALKPHATLEVLIEDLEVKRQVMARLPFDVRRVLLMTNTSSYLPTDIHDRAMGLHFFNPVAFLRCVEVCAFDEQLTGEAASFLEVLRRFGFERIRTAPHRGYIANTLLFQEIAHALQLIDRFQYSTRTIDTVQRYTGRTTSLFDIIDVIGVDVTKRILDNLREHHPDLPVSPLLEHALLQGVYGNKNQTSIRTVLDHVETRPAAAGAST